jgi:crotonobetainyl-CoA:carnitine CoA-transferase CaiB-like acyl-CoA transferase
MQPLEGIKVLDLSRLAPGPFATMVLADLGADVLMIEAPSGATSALPRPGGGADPGREAAFDPLRRNKRSLVLNLKDERGRAILHRLAGQADVLVEGFRPGVTARLGADHGTLSRINPRLVVCSVTGYGQNGPYAQQVGHDINYISVGGLLGMVGWPGQPPAIPGNIVADFAGGGLHAALGVLAALIARGTTGRGQHVDIAMTDGVLYLLATWAQGVLAGGPPPAGGRHWLNGLLPHYTVYQTKDGSWISIGSLESKFWRNLCRVLDAERFADHSYDPATLKEARAHFAERFKTRTRDEWMALLSQEEICAAPVYSLDETLADPHIRAREMVATLEHPRYGPVRQVGVAPKFSETPGAVRTLPPETGADTTAVLETLGYGPQEIATLRGEGVVG